MHKHRTVVYDLHPIIEEIRSGEGLPESLSTEAQLWDEIMKKETFLMPQQLFPLIKEVHGKDYPPNAEIKPLATEYSVERMDTQEIASIRADITVLVEGRDIYHFECQISKDGTMVMRMFEYDIHIAISYAHTNDCGQYEIHFPKSAVLYLQSVGDLAKFLHCSVVFQDGSQHEYQVPVFQVQEYTLEEIREKHLCVLIPFLPLRFREKSSSDLKKISREQLTDFYEEIILILEQEVEEGYLTENNKKTILSLLSKSLIRVFYKDRRLLEEVIVMTAPILELEFEKVERLEKELLLLKEQNEQIRAQHEQIQAQHEQMQAQREQMQAQHEQIQEQMQAQYNAEIEHLKAELAKYKALAGE